MGRTIVIGDVHGCLDELEDLLKTVDRRSDDRVLIVGDLVDRGPDSIGVIRYCIENGIESIMGNHDEKHVRHARKMEIHPDSRVGFKTEAEREMWRQLSTEELVWLSSLPSMVRLDTHLVVVHAGMLPQLSPEVQLERVMHRCRYVEQRVDKKTGQLCWEMARMKIVETEQGNGFLRPVDSVYWTSVWSGPDSVLYGHNVTKGPAIEQEQVWKPYCVGLDTGAAFGMTLTAAVYESTACSNANYPDRPQVPPFPQLVSVKSNFRCEADLFYEDTYVPEKA